MLDQMLQKDAKLNCIDIENLHGVELEQVLKRLNTKKRQMDSRSEQTKLILYSNFLSKTRNQKIGELEKLKAEIDCLTHDLQMVSDCLTTKYETEVEVLPTAQVPESINSEFGPRKKVHLSKSRAILNSNVSVEDSHQFRLNPHLSDLQNLYFGWRQASPQSKVTDFESSHEHNQFADNLVRCSKYSKFRTLANLHNADHFYNYASSIVSSIEFDKDDEFFATAGVTKRIKLYEYKSVVDPGDSNVSSFITRTSHTPADYFSDNFLYEIDPHALTHQEPTSLAKYPIREMDCSSKLSCLSWNAYIKAYLLSSDYEGVVGLWDTAVGSCILQLDEHEKRAWSVDFSELNPTQMASGGDDSKVKLWSTQQRYSTGTIESKGNVCSVKFNPVNCNYIAFGAADHHVHYYDLRRMDSPVNIYKGHRKAVSYVKFLNSSQIVTASTDCTLRLWSLNSPMGLSECMRTFAGHTNEKNFVGLSVNSDGEFISCGSETNQVYAYHSKLTKPVVSHRFENSIDPVTGAAVQSDDHNQFISSVCWKRKSPNILISANSQGRVKVLELI